MRDVAKDPAVLELRRAQLDRLADRLRPPWWYLPGTAIAWAVAFAGPFTLRYFPRVDYWIIAVVQLAVWCLLQWGLTRATGIKVGPRPLRVLRDGLFYYRPGRPALIAIIVVSLGVGETEFLLLRHSRLAAAIVVAVFGIAVEVALQQAWLREIRQGLRDGRGTA